jgi:hypothetical protein
MITRYDELVLLTEERRRELLADAALSRLGRVEGRARPAPPGLRVRAGAAALLFGLAVRLDRRYSFDQLAVGR